MPPASWERRHPAEAESWAFDFFSADGSLGGFVGITFRPRAGIGWYWAGLVGDGRPYLLVRDLEAPLPRQPGSRDVRSEGLWANINCEVPFEHWSLGLEAFGVALDDPDQALAGERGDRVALGLDLEWEAGAELVGDERRYAQPGTVHGEVLVGGGGVETIAFDGHGWRRHAREAVDSLTPARSWLGGRLDDGTPQLLEPLPEDVGVEPLHRAPLALEAGGRHAVLERWLCRFAAPGRPGGTGWAEWLRPRAGS